MLDLAVSGYTKDEVINQLHAKSGVREVKFRFDLLNRYDEVIGEVTTPSNGGNRISMNSLAEIKRTGNFSVKDNEANDIDWLNNRIKPVFLLKMPNGNFAEWNLGIFMLSSPTRRERDNGIWRDIEAYDPSLILRQDKFDNRYRIPANTKYTQAIITILSNVGIIKVNIPDSPLTLGTDKEFEIGTTKLEAINTLLAEINYTSLWVDANGYFTAQPYILPSDREVEYSYKNDSLSVIHDGSVEELDLFSVPNKWVVVASKPEELPLVSKYVNDSPTSVTSTIRRERSIVDYRQVNDIADQGTLDDFVKRIAYEASNVYGKFIFQTAVMPHHSFMDMLFIEHTSMGVSNRFTEVSWNMELAAGGKMEHECRRVIHI